MAETVTIFFRFCTTTHCSTPSVILHRWAYRVCFWRCNSAIQICMIVFHENKNTQNKILTRSYSRSIDCSVSESHVRLLGGAIDISSLSLYSEPSSQKHLYTSSKNSIRKSFKKWSSTSRFFIHACCPIFCAVVRSIHPFKFWNGVNKWIQKKGGSNTRPFENCPPM